VLGLDARVGSLSPGKEADLVVLDLQHPLGWTSERVLSDLVYRAGPQHVREVIVAGRTIYAEGGFTHIDAAELTAGIHRHFAHGE
jgi:5-methylthioadenosine/S-adenosylhomocysteine deaminase